MYSNYLFKSLSLSKILSGLNKGLDIFNKALPLYQQVKPIISNAKGLMSIIDIMNTPDNKDDSKKITEVKEIKKESNNLPTFFQ